VRQRHSARIREPDPTPRELAARSVSWAIWPDQAEPDPTFMDAARQGGLQPPPAGVTGLGAAGASGGPGEWRDGGVSRGSPAPLAGATLGSAAAHRAGLLQVDRGSQSSSGWARVSRPAPAAAGACGSGGRGRLGAVVDAVAASSKLARASLRHTPRPRDSSSSSQ
jgi:hypothetical protein